MSNLFTFLLMTLLLTISTCAPAEPDHLVFVRGGAFKNARSNYFGTHVRVSNFYIEDHEVTQKEWFNVMGSNPSKFRGDHLPVEMISWYDSVVYCNMLSVKQGRQPYYRIIKKKVDPNNHSNVDVVRWLVTITPGANGYRLPTEAEWEYAAGGGQLSKGYSYSGGDNLDQVGWYWRNSGDTLLQGMWLWPVLENNRDRTRPVKSKKCNELGLYDMSGNVREWCWDWYGPLTFNRLFPLGSTSGTVRVWKGGGWVGAEYCCESSFRGSYEANSRVPDLGLRVCCTR